MHSWLRHALLGAGISIAVVPVAACGSSAIPASASTGSSRPASLAVTAGTSRPAASGDAVCGSAEVIAQRMGMKSLTVYTAVTDPNHLLGRQGEYTSKVEWRAAGENSGIEVFTDMPDARMRYVYLRAFRPPLGDGYDYLDRRAVLRLASIYTPAQASALKASFERSCTGNP